MPIKSISASSIVSTPSAEPSATINQKDVKSKLPSFSSMLIFIVMIVFLISVSFEVNQQLGKEASYTEMQAKTCLIDFQSKSCNPLDMNQECLKIFRCIQKLGHTSMISKITTILYIGYLQIKQNGFIPAILMVLIFLYQIATSMKLQDTPTDKKIDF